MNETLVLTRRLRPNLVLPAILRALHSTFIFWRRVPSDRWDWLALLISLLLFAFFLLGFYRAFTGDFSFLTGLLLSLFAKDIHDNALPIFARVRIRGDKVTLGTIFTERFSLAEIEHYSVSHADLPLHTVRVSLSERYWHSRFSLVVDEEDSARLIEFLEVRGIGDRIAYLEQLSPEESEAATRELMALAQAKLSR